MAYTPNKFPADRFTFTAGAAITEGQLVYLSAANTVSPTSTATSAWVGVAAFTCASGDKLTVYTEGAHTLAASGAIAFGENVIPAAAGAVATQGTASAANAVQVCGVALNTAASNLVTVLLR
jgi:hypothetical protein